ncbi:hypothetical protein BCR35DRAFT_349630 [Leucosporidium creatinivorum]|uniref:Protein CPL1-like domain-containing protein n=1 Tax=Leucosporidium creatinivorum TaxID=106004 RepID=A0A1Y2G196_9BASI|nr:hypothetical protein BCR35DRAFT_349630 [Leucosporidium creatinivorum]
MPQSLLLLLSAVLLAASPALAIGDFPCDGSTDAQSCAAWSVDANAQGTISSTAECFPDPINPTISYCGYASAACTTGDDCDYGSCGSNGKCTGYLGDLCPNGQNDCQAFFFCGTDGRCGGTGAECANGAADSPIPNPEQQCVSQVCDTTTKTCTAPPTAGVPNGYGCGNGDICASGFCSSSDLCAVQPSGASSKKVKRYVLNGSGPNVDSCPSGQTACAVGNSLSDGFECIDSQNNLEQCGGCVTNGEGEDCTMIHGVEAVECQQGRCIVLSCVPGLVVSADSAACTL